MSGPQKPLELILARNLLTSVTTPAFLVARDGTLLFYNEGAGALIGRPFEDIGQLDIDEWTSRFGPFDEVGCFDLSGDGIVAVTDPTGLFVARHHEPVPGTCVSVVLEGRRPILAEVQALVTPATAERPRRTTSGLDSSRVAMLVAVLQQRARIRLHSHDVFASTVGGVRIAEPAADLASAIAVASAWKQRDIPTDLVAIGELGLAGELRRVRDIPQRLAEAARLGFRGAIVPAESHREAGAVRMVDGMKVIGVPDIDAALRVLDLGVQDSTPVFVVHRTEPGRPALRGV